MDRGRILVTGGTGFIGQRLVVELLAVGHPVCLLTRRLLTNAQVDVRYAADLGDENALREVMGGVDAVCHLAGRAHVIGKLPADQEFQFEKINVELSCRLAEAAFQRGVKRFVFVSSIGAVANSSKPGKPLNEQSECHPMSQYGRSKLRAERILRDMANRYGAELVVVRPPLVYGKNAPGNLARLVRWIRRGIPLPLGSIVNQRSLIHVDNLAHILRLCLVHPRAAGQIFHVRDRRDYSTPEILNCVASSMGCSARLLPFPLPMLDVLTRVIGQGEVFQQLTGWLQIDDSHVRSTLDFVPSELPFEVS